jgi:homeobox protein cut-like
VTSQRDRFRARNAELEDELRKQFQTISGLRGEVKSLQADNLKLYEKVRYMQSYREDSRSSTSGKRELTGAGPSANGRVEGDGLGQYRERYEEAMNPFQAFRGRVSIFRIYCCAG